MHTGILGPAVMGLITSVLAPLLVLAGHRLRPAARVPSRAHPWRAAGILTGFAVVHAVTVLAVGPGTDPGVGLALHAAVLGGAVVFWLPVLGRGTTRLPEAGRSIYLFLACPVLDTAALALVVRGDEPAGIAMVVGMLPMGLVAIVLTLRWVAAEERVAATPLERTR
jgi:cytochrome c oxidase assembly factor CtaG